MDAILIIVIAFLVGILMSVNGVFIGLVLALLLSAVFRISLEDIVMITMALGAIIGFFIGFSVVFVPTKK